MDRHSVTFSLFSKFANSPNKLESYFTNVLDFQICLMVLLSHAKYQFSKIISKEIVICTIDFFYPTYILIY
jgi:hypothetical protein